MSANRSRRMSDLHTTEIGLGQISVACAIQFDILQQRIDKLWQHRMRHDHSSDHLVRTTEVLNEVDDKLGRRRHDDHPRAEDAARYMVRNARMHGMLVRRIGAVFG